MTRDRLYAIAAGLVSSDSSSLPSDVDGELVGLLQMALEITTYESEPALLTFNMEEWNDGTLAGRRFVRTVELPANEIRPEPVTRLVVAPRLPIDGEDELDMDEGLCFATARFLASYCCKPENAAMHITLGKDICKAYTAETIKGVPVDMKEF